MNQAIKTKDVNAYAKEHQLDTLFQKLMDKVLNEMPDDPQEYIVQKISETHGLSSKDRLPAKRLASSQSGSLLSTMPKSSLLRNSASALDKWDDDVQKAFSSVESADLSHQTVRPSSRTIPSGKFKSQLKATESLPIAPASSIPLRKSIQGMSLEGRNVSFEEPSESLGKVYLKQSNHPKARETLSSSTGFRAESPPNSAQHRPQPSYAAPIRTVARSQSKERNRLPSSDVTASTAPAPAVNKSSSHTASHKVAPFSPPEPEHIAQQDDAGSVSGPGRKKKLLMREQKRKHREEMVKFIDSMNGNSNNTDNKDEAVANTGDRTVEAEVERLLSRCRKTFGASQYLKSVNTDEQEPDALDENNRHKRKGSTSKKSNTVVIMYDNKGDERKRLQTTGLPGLDVEEEVVNNAMRPPRKDVSHAFLARQSSRSAWDEESTPASPSAITGPKMEDFFREPSGSTSSKTRQSQKGTRGNTARPEEEKQEHSSEHGDSGDRPWLQSASSSKRSKPPKQQQQQAVEFSKPAPIASAGAIPRSRTSSTSSISDIFNSNQRGSRRL